MTSRSGVARFFTRLWVIVTALWLAGGIAAEYRDYLKQQVKYEQNTASQITYLDRLSRLDLDGGIEHNVECADALSGLPSSNLREPNFVEALIDADKKGVFHSSLCPALGLIYVLHKQQILSFATWDPSKFQLNWSLLALIVVSPIALYGLGAALFWASGPLRE